MKQLNLLQRLPDGTYIDWGRNASVGGTRGEGGAVLYTGEDARILDLVLKHQKGPDHARHLQQPRPPKGTPGAHQSPERGGESPVSETADAGRDAALLAIHEAGRRQFEARVALLKIEAREARNAAIWRVVDQALEIQNRLRWMQMRLILGI